MNKISFSDAEKICNTLAKFAEARTGAKPNKDIILVVKKISGKDTLEVAELSKLKWHQRLIRFFGFGNTSLKAVASFLNQNEPYLPPSFSQLQEKKILKLYYDEKDIDTISSLKKDQYKLLKQNKIIGFQTFQKCIDHHNQKSKLKVKLINQQNEKIDLQHSMTSFGKHAGPRPLGIFNNEENKITQNFFAKSLKGINDPNILGFCHEYGLGTPINLEKATEYYKKGSDTDYAALFNLGRIYLQKNDPTSAAQSFSKAKEILNQEIAQKKNTLTVLDSEKKGRSQDPRLVEHHQEFVKKRKADLTVQIKALEKALVRVELGLKEAENLSWWLG